VSSMHLTEQQQIEQLKEWWKKHGTSTLVTFIIVFCLGLGWRLWMQHYEAKLERGSTHYEELLNAVVNNDDTAALKQANLLKNNYVHTPYAALATLMLARSDVYRNDYADAEGQLNWVMQHASTRSLREVARLRLARINLQLGQPQQSLLLLQKVDDASYAVMIDEIKGDAYAALNQIDMARQSYQKALAELPGYANTRPILTMKLNNLTENP